jgi:hypothetical protein
MNDNIRKITKVVTLGWMAVNSTNRKKFPIRIFQALQFLVGSSRNKSWKKIIKC